MANPFEASARAHGNPFASLMAESENPEAPPRNPFAAAAATVFMPMPGDSAPVPSRDAPTATAGDGGGATVARGRALGADGIGINDAGGDTDRCEEFYRNGLCSNPFCGKPHDVTIAPRVAPAPARNCGEYYATGECNNPRCVDEHHVTQVEQGRCEARARTGVCDNPFCSKWHTRPAGPAPAAAAAPEAAPAPAPAPGFTLGATPRREQPARV